MDLSMEHVQPCKAENLMEHMQPDKVENSMPMAQYVPESAQDLPFDRSNMFLAGYMDCAQEALWYLMEGEKLLPDHPTVVELKLHLYKQYRMLQIQHMLSNALHIFNGDDTDVRLNNESEINGKACDVIVKDANEGVSKCAIDTDSMSKYEESVQENSSTTKVESEYKNDQESSVKFEEHSLKTQGVADQENVPDSELSPEAHMIAMALAEDIYALLQCQDDVSEDRDDLSEDLDYLSDTDIEHGSVDEGFGEMIEP